MTAGVVAPFSKSSPAPASQEITLADTGLGTTYERWALNRCLSRLQAGLGIRSVMEGPGDGMTGIAGLNSVPLGLGGARVSLLLPDAARAGFARSVWQVHAVQADLQVVEAWDGEGLPFDDEAFDLAWNFNVMTRLPDPARMLQEMRRVSRRYVLVFVPNRSNYAFWLHRLHHHVAVDPWDHGRVDLMEPAPWRRWLASSGLRLRQIVWLDCPWWPDIVDFGQLIGDFFPPLRRLSGRARPENRLRWSAEALPYYRPDAYPKVHKQMSRLAFFENSSQGWLKKRFAHHLGILAEKG